MSNFYQRPDDLPPRIPVDDSLQRQLDQAITQHFYNTCDRLTQKCLSNCGWYMTTSGIGLTLVIICPDRRQNWEVLKYLPSLSKYLKEFAPNTRIRIYPPAGDGTSLEMGFQLSVMS